MLLGKKKKKKSRAAVEGRGDAMEVQTENMSLLERERKGLKS